MPQTDLFTTDNPNELAYAAAIAALAQAEENYRIDNGIIPPWVEASYLLAKDERRLLDMVEQHAGYIILDGDMVEAPYAEPDSDSLFPDMQPERMVSRFTVDMGMNAEANSKAVLNAAIERGLITVARDNYVGGLRIGIAKRGRYYLELVDTDEYWESEDSE